MSSLTFCCACPEKNIKSAWGHGQCGRGSSTIRGGNPRRLQEDQSHRAATTEELFIADKVLPAAVLHHLTVIGEAINRLSRELRGRHHGVPWQQIVGVRHRIAHAYFDLGW